MNRKILKVTLTVLGETKEFTSSEGSNQLSATGLRIAANIISGNGSVMPNAQIKIYGLKFENMLNLLRLQWHTLQALMSTVKLEAGEEGGNLSIVYEGNITFAYPDMTAAPNVALTIESMASVVESLQVKSLPDEIKDSIDAAALIETICGRMGYVFENHNNASHMINGTYEGSDLNRIRTICAACDFDLYTEKNLIAISPKGVARKIPMPVITPKSGLVGYPTPDLRGIKFKCLYDKSLRFGGLVEVKDSEITVCNNKWRVYGLTISLDSETQKGNWFCEVNGSWADSKDAAISR